MPFVSLSVFLCCCLLLGAPLSSSAATPATRLPEAGTWQARREAFARVAAWAESRTRLPFPLRVTASEVAPGRAVAKGDALVRFHAPRLVQGLAAYLNARHKARVAARWVDTLRRNDKGRTVPRHDLLTALQEQASLEAALSAAWDRLYADLSVLGSPPERKAMDRRLRDPADVQALAAELGVLRAPFAGVVRNRPPPVGAWVDADTPLVELEDLARVFVSVGVPEGDLEAWRGGETEVVRGPARLALSRLPGAPGIDPGTGLRLIRYRADNPAGRLRDGQWVRVVHRAAPRPVLWVPEAAVVSRHGRAWCLVAKAGAITPVAVRVGPVEKGRVPVLSGLKAGQAVLVEDAYEWLYRDLKDLIRFVD